MEFTLEIMREVALAAVDAVDKDLEDNGEADDQSKEEYKNNVEHIRTAQYPYDVIGVLSDVEGAGMEYAAYWLFCGLCQKARIPFAAWYPHEGSK